MSGPHTPAQGNEYRPLPSQEDALALMKRVADELERTGRKPDEKEAQLIKHLIDYVAGAKGEEVKPELLEELEEHRKRVRLLLSK